MSCRTAPQRYTTTVYDEQALGALRAPPVPVCTVYDADGKAIATINPLTRERTPL